MQKNKFWANKNRFVQIRPDFLAFLAQNAPYIFGSLLILGMNMNNIDQPMAIIVLIHHIIIKFNKLMQCLLLYHDYNTVTIDCIDIIWFCVILPCNFAIWWLPKHNTQLKLFEIDIKTSSKALQIIIVINLYLFLIIMSLVSSKTIQKQVKTDDIYNTK